MALLIRLGTLSLRKVEKPLPFGTKAEMVVLAAAQVQALAVQQVAREEQMGVMDKVQLTTQVGEEPDRELIHMSLGKYLLIL